MPGVTNEARDLRALRQRRYQIAPQMRDYDLLGRKRWLPYVMFFQPPGLTTSSFTTDEQGFRGTLCQGQRVCYCEFHTHPGRRGLLLGASAAFGVGATSDGATLASRLNDDGQRLWFNYAGRAFNSTQEILLFLLHLPDRLDTVLLLTGVNHAVLSHLAQETSPVYNSFFFQSIFEQGMNGGPTPQRGGLWRLLKGALLRPQEERQPLPPAPASEAQRYENALTCLRRDMRLWGLLREAMGFQLCFAFQPVLPWIDKPLTWQEQALFWITDTLFPEGSANGFMDFLLRQKGRFVADVESICSAQKIPFLDLNQSPAFRRPDWLFVDRVHLTDAGYAAAREEIRKRFSI